MTRDERQEQIVNKWISAGKVAGFEAVTGFGKTRVSVMAAKKINPEKTTVIVPTVALKEQWEKILKSFKIKNSEVLVVNTAYKLEITTDYLILDEVHTVGAAEQFSLCWKNATFNSLMWLTATFDRKDGLHNEMLKIAPKIDSVNFKEALDNNWVSNYRIFNIPLEFNEEERLEAYRIEQRLEHVYKVVAEEINRTIEYVSKEMFKLCPKIVAAHKAGNLGKEAFLAALNYYKLINKRKQLIYNAQAKKDKALWFLKDSKLNKKQSIVFSQTQEFADHVYNEFEDQSVVIHSKMTKKAREKALKSFLDGRTKKRIISSVKALNEGIDVPSLEVGICASGNGSKKDGVQMLGRVCRLFGDKEAIFINFYIKGTQDLYWLKNRQTDLPKDKITWLKN